MLVSVRVAPIIGLAIGISRYWASSALSTIGVFIELVTNMS